MTIGLYFSFRETIGVYNIIEKMLKNVFKTFVKKIN